MRTTVDLPDELYRQAKAEATLRGRNFKDLIEEGLRRLLRAPEPEAASKTPPGPSVHDLMLDCCGIAQDAPSDCAINPKYTEDFGRYARSGGRYRTARGAFLSKRSPPLLGRPAIR